MSKTLLIVDTSSCIDVKEIKAGDIIMCRDRNGHPYICVYCYAPVSSKLEIGDGTKPIPFWSIISMRTGYPEIDAIHFSHFFTDANTSGRPLTEWKFVKLLDQDI